MRAQYLWGNSEQLASILNAFYVEHASCRVVSETATTLHTMQLQGRPRFAKWHLGIMKIVRGLVVSKLLGMMFWRCIKIKFICCRLFRRTRRTGPQALDLRHRTLGTGPSALICRDVGGLGRKIQKSLPNFPPGPPLLAWWEVWAEKSRNLSEIFIGTSTPLLVGGLGRKIQKSLPNLPSGPPFVSSRVPPPCPL